MTDVILPVLDEAAALPWVLARMPAGYRAIVVDNGSTDGSAGIARELGATVVSEPRRGFGAACFAGLLAATSDVVCFMDADASLDPRELPAIAAPVTGGKADLVLGTRIAQPGAWPLHARLANRALAYELRRRSGLAVTDLGPMRAARRAALIELGIADRRFGWPLEMVLRAARADWRVEELPVPYLPRSGRSKVTGTVRGTVRTVRDMAAVLSVDPPNPTASRLRERFAGADRPPRTGVHGEDSRPITAGSTLQADQSTVFDGSRRG